MMRREIISFVIIILACLNSDVCSSIGDGDIAICISGHVRSLIQKNVYQSLKQNLLDPISIDNKGTDLFLYLELDENQNNSHLDIESRINSGWDSGPIEMKTSKIELEKVISILDPVRLEFHGDVSSSSSSLEEDFGLDSTKLNDCEYPSKKSKPQLLKMFKCFTYVLTHEQKRGYLYQWVIRSRPDLGWLWPTPSVTKFDLRYIYVTSKYWPMGDQFALIPRQFAGVYFNAYQSYQSCVEANSTTQKRWLRDNAGGPEQLLWKHLFDYNIKVRFYPFSYVIVRPKPGAGVCKSLWNHISELCIILHDINYSPFQYASSSSSVDSQNVETCTHTLFQASEFLCLEKFPLNDENDDDLKKQENLRLISFIQFIKEINIHQTFHRKPEILNDFIKPIIMTSTGGELQSGQVATALVLRKDLIDKVDSALSCLLFEYEIMLNQLIMNDYPSPLSSSSSSYGTVSAIVELDDGNDVGKPQRNKDHMEKEIYQQRIQELTSEHQCSHTFSNVLHEAELVIASATLVQVTCQGEQCLPDSEDYQTLINALKHEIENQ